MKQYELQTKSIWLDLWTLRGFFAKRIGLSIFQWKFSEEVSVRMSRAWNHWNHWFRRTPGIAAFQLAHNQSPIKTPFTCAPSSYPSLRQHLRPVRRATHPIHRKLCKELTSKILKNARTKAAEARLAWQSINMVLPCCTPYSVSIHWRNRSGICWWILAGKCYNS